MFSATYTVERSIVIARPANEIFPHVADLQKWLKWSPFFSVDPDTTIKIEGTPGTTSHRQTWESPIVGSGTMGLKSLTPDKAIVFELQFLKPFKARSQPTFTFAPAQGGTNVTWTMTNSLPFFLLFFRKMIAAYIGRDFERGLSMLKEVVETGTVPSRIEVKGEVKVDGFHYVGIMHSCNIPDVSKSMSDDFTKLLTLVEKGELPKPVSCLSFTHKWDLQNQICEYTAALAYNSAPTGSAASSMKQGEIPSHAAYRLDHIGPYRFLSNGWASLMARQRSSRMKTRKSIPIYEIYRTMPDATPEKDVVTELYLPLKK